MIRNKNYYLAIASLFQHDDLSSLLCDLASVLLVGRLSLDHVGVIQNAKNYSPVTITLVNLFHVFIVSGLYLFLSSPFSFMLRRSGAFMDRRIVGPRLSGIGHFVIAYCISTIVLSYCLVNRRCTIRFPPSLYPFSFFYWQFRLSRIGPSWFSRPFSQQSFIDLLLGTRRSDRPRPFLYIHALLGGRGRPSCGDHLPSQLYRAFDHLS